MGSLYLGLEYDLSKIQGRDTNYNEIAHYLVARKTVAIFQGRSEAGPRALGNRSILYDPRDPHGKEKLNLVKNREPFRPFACSVLLHHAHNWFDMGGLTESPFMMYAVQAQPQLLHIAGETREQTDSLWLQFGNVPYFSHTEGESLGFLLSLNKLSKRLEL